MATESAAHEIEQRPEPVSRPKILADGVMGMLLFVFAEIMMFAGLISAHRIVRSQVAGQTRLPVQETAVNTAALLVSGIVLVFAHLAFKKEASRARLPILIALLLGLFFVGSQGAEWVALLGEGLTIQSSTYGGFFYLIVGAHGLHAIAAILALGWASFELYKGRLTGSQLATVSVFWYFVVLLWPVLYLIVYL